MGCLFEICGLKGITRGNDSNARTPANKMELLRDRTGPLLLSAARTMLQIIFTYHFFWPKQYTACYVLNMAFRVYNLETKRVEENLHINFLENKPNVAGKGPNWLFDLDYLTDSMNYHSVRSENQANLHAGQQESNQNTGTKDKIDAGDSEKEDESDQDCFELPIWNSYSSTNSSVSKSDNKRGSPREEEQVFLDDLARLQRQEKEANEEAEALRKNLEQETENLVTQAGAAKSSSTNIFSTVSTTAKASGTNLVNTVSIPVSTASPNKGLSLSDTTNSQEDDSEIPPLEDIHEDTTDGIFTHSSYDDDSAEGRLQANLETVMGGLGGDGVWRGVWMGVYYGCEKDFLYARLFEEGILSQPPVFLDPNLREQSTNGKLVWVNQAPDIMLAEIPEKFDFASVKTASTLIETQKPFVKDEEANDVDSVLVLGNPQQEVVNFLAGDALLWQMQKANHVGYFTTEAEFKCKVTPLFDTMLVQPTQDEGASSERLSVEQPSPSPAPTNESLPDSSSAQPSEVPFEQQPDPSPRPSPRPSPTPSPTPIVPDSIPEPTDQAKEIKLLKAKITKLKKQAKPVIKHHKEYLKIISLQQRFPKKSFSKKQRVHKKSVSKQGRKKAKGESEVHRDPLFDVMHEDKIDHMETENAQSEGRTREMVDEVKEFDEDRLSTEDVVSTDKEGVSTDFEKVSTDRPIVSTDRPIVSTDESKVSTDEQVEGTEESNESTEEIFESTEEQREGTEEKVESTVGQREGTEDQTKEEIASKASQTSTQTPTSMTFGDDETIATLLLNMSKAKAASKEKEKGVELKDVEEIDRPRPTSTRSLLTLKPLPKIDPKDKGKKKIEEEDESESEDDDIPQAVKKFKQLESDEELARKIQEEWEAEEERNKIAEEKATNEALIKNFDDIKARIEADRILAEKLQEQEREQFTIEERAKFLHDTIAAQRKFLAQQRSEAIRNRPPTKNQLRNQMMTYLKHVGNFKHSELRNGFHQRRKDQQNSKEESRRGIKENRIKKEKATYKEKDKSPRKRRFKQDTSQDDPSDIEKENDELRLCLTIAPERDKVHTLMTDEGLVVHMLIEKKYPLKKKILMQMLKLKLESEKESTMALELIRFIKKVLADLESKE
ncbi:hypothetical protein Tco_0840918 [Tanacetum coccineum]|uniref:Uncharacterized protein n=1 Tax=Tanacetum coccineum TaxID=301880 RepID=A0ABQ5AUX0_9ASTR